MTSLWLIHDMYSIQRMREQERVKEREKMYKKNLCAYSLSNGWHLPATLIRSHHSCVYVCIYNIFNVFLFFGYALQKIVCHIFAPHKAFVAFNMTFSLLYDWNKHHSLEMRLREWVSETKGMLACVCVHTHINKRVLTQTNKYLGIMKTIHIESK